MHCCKKYFSDVSNSMTSYCYESVFLDREHRAFSYCQSLISATARLHCQLPLFTIIWHLTSLYCQNPHLDAKARCHCSLPSASSHCQPYTVSSPRCTGEGTAALTKGVTAAHADGQQCLQSCGSMDCKPSLATASVEPWEQLVCARVTLPHATAP